MKKVFLLFLLAGLMTLPILTSCDKTKVKMEVVKDCTGIYLRDKSGKDYKVCNEFMLDKHLTGTKIQVRFDNLNECFGLIEEPQCTESHDFEGLIEVTEIL